MEAFHANDTVFAVFAVDRKVCGADGAVVSSGVLPSQAFPLSLQFDGTAAVPPGLPLKPNVAVWPGASVPFHPLSTNVKWSPVRVMAASQKLPTAEPAGRSNSTFHPVSVVVPAFATAYSPENPVPQSETLR